MNHMDSLTFRTARNRVEGYKDASDALMLHHHEAMECRTCESFLQMGIEAYQWAIRCDQYHRLEAFKDESAWDQELADSLERLFRVWLEACGMGKKLIQLHVNRGFEVKNGEEFLRCCEQVEAIVESFGDTGLPEPMAELCGEALEEYRNGETAAFI